MDHSCWKIPACPVGGNGGLSLIDILEPDAGGREVLPQLAPGDVRRLGRPGAEASIHEDGPAPKSGSAEVEALRALFGIRALIVGIHRDLAQCASLA
jgi:hypothetical protein